MSEYHSDNLTPSSLKGKALELIKDRQVDGYVYIIDIVTFVSYVATVDEARKRGFMCDDTGGVEAPYKRIRNSFVSKATMASIYNAASNHEKGIKGETKAKTKELLDRLDAEVTETAGFLRVMLPAHS
jgi:hypothetical protein